MGWSDDVNTELNALKYALRPILTKLLVGKPIKTLANTTQGLSPYNDNPYREWEGVIRDIGWDLEVIVQLNESRVVTVRGFGKPTMVDEVAFHLSNIADEYERIVKES